MSGGRGGRAEHGLDRLGARQTQEGDEIAAAGADQRLVGGLALEAVGRCGLERSGRNGGGGGELVGLFGGLARGRDDVRDDDAGVRLAQAAEGGHGDVIGPRELADLGPALVGVLDRELADGRMLGAEVGQEAAMQRGLQE